MQTRTKIAAAAGATVLAVAGVVVLVERDDDSTSTARPEASATPTEPPREPTVEAAITVDERATDVAMKVLADGGTAADAAFASAGVLSVVEPYYSNLIGGETAALYYDESEDDVQSLDGVGFVGEDYDRGDYRGGTPFGLDQAIVPGSWDGWMVLLAEHGELEVSRLLQPAIELARDGHEATAELARQVQINQQGGGLNAAARAVYVPDGRAVRAGDTVVQADFADTLQQISDAADSGDDRDAGIEAARDLVYRGALADDMVAEAREGGATFTADDLAGFEAELRDPISLEFGDTTVFQAPPSSQGITMLTALNTLEKAGLEENDAETADTAHLQIEALKLAMADREEHVGDPELTDVPVDELLSDAYGEDQLDRIDLDDSIDAPVRSGIDNTTTFQIVDSSGDAVAVTTSTGYQMIAAGDTGIMLNNRLRYMTADDRDSPNFIEPGKKVRYTGNPYLATGPDGLEFLGGAVGGDTQAQVQTQIALGVLAFGRTAEEAVAHPRFVTQSGPNSVAPHGTPNTTRTETSTPGGIVSSLRQRGQRLVLQSGSGPFGYSTMLRIVDGGRSADLGVDPRVDGASGKQREAA